MAAWELCSKEDVVSLHPIPLADLQDSWSEMVEALIRQYMGEPNLGTSQVVTDEWHDGDGTNILRVKKPRIISAEKVSINEITLTASDYVVFDTFIELKTQVFPRGTLNARVSYTSGSGVDPVVRLAAVAMLAAIANYRKRGGADMSIKWGDPAKRTGEETPNQNVGLTSHLTTIMKRTLQRNIVRMV